MNQSVVKNYIAGLCLTFAITYFWLKRYQLFYSWCLQKSHWLWQLQHTEPFIL